MTDYLTPRPLSEWTEETGDVLWWRFPIDEPPYVGSPLDEGFPVRISVSTRRKVEVQGVYVGGWPGYHTHWTPIPKPEQPA